MSSMNKMELNFEQLEQVNGGSWGLFDMIEEIGEVIVDGGKKIVNAFEEPPIRTAVDIFYPGASLIWTCIEVCN